MTKAKDIINETMGIVAMYNVPTDIHVPMAKFMKVAQKNGVPMHLLPLELSPKGAFQRACTKLRDAYKGDPEPINVKEVESVQNSGVIIRTFERRLTSSDKDVEAMENGEQYVPIYKPVVTIMFDTNTTDMTYKLYDKVEGKRIYKEVEAHYQKTCGMANVQQVRGTIQNALRYYGSIKMPVRGGNFVPECYAEDWENFTKFAETFEGVRIINFEINGTSLNKRNVQDSLLDDVASSIESEIKKLDKTTGSSDLSKLVTEFSKILKENQSSKKKLGSAALERMLARYNETMEKVKLYQELLQTDLSVIDGQVEIAKKQVMKLIDSAE